MNAAEAKTFESNPYFKKPCLRGYDEAAKEQSCKVAPVESYESMLRRHLIEPLSKSKMTFLRRMVSFGSSLGSTTMRWLRLRNRCENGKLARGSRKWMSYFEYTSNQRTLCRIENFLEYEEVLSPIC